MIGVAALALGLPIGGVIGAFGGGAGTPTVPVLVYLLDQSAQDAMAGSLVIVGLAALAGALGHLRTRTIRWDMAVPFGFTGIVGAVTGTSLSRGISGDVLMLAVALLMGIAAAVMFRQGRRPVAVPPGGTLGAEGLPDRRAHAAAAGFAVGLLTGFVGIAGGWVIVPVLTIGLGLPMTEAVGTALAITVVNCAAALLARSGALHLDLAVIAPFALTAVLATVAGRRAAARLAAPVLTKAFACLLAGLAVVVATQSVLAG